MARSRVMCAIVGILVKHRSGAEAAAAVIQAWQQFGVPVK